MKTVILEALEILDKKLRDEIESINNVAYSSEKRRLAGIRLKIQECINELLLMG